MSENRLRQAWVLQPRGVTWLGVVVNVLLTSGKILAGVLCNSQTILADGLHSGSDLVTDAAVLAGLRVSDKPADRTHHYGHRRVDTLVAMFVGALLLAAGGWIAWNAVESLHHRTDPVRGYLPLVMAVLSIILKEALYHVTILVGRWSGNVSLKANAWHHRSDAFSSVAAAAGLMGVAVGGASWQFLDALTAMVLAAFLVVIAVRLMYDNGSELMDRAPGDKTLKAIEAVVTATPGVRDHHAFRARQIGGRVAMDIHVLVDPDLTVRQGHDIAAEVKRKVMQSDPSVVEVIVHVEPVENNNQK